MANETCLSQQIRSGWTFQREVFQHRLVCKEKEGPLMEGGKCSGFQGRNGSHGGRLRSYLNVDDGLSIENRNLLTDSE